MNEDDAKPRRYTEEEFALILRKAAELQPSDSREPGQGRVSGLTMEEMRSIAQEAGLDPEAVTRAASLLGALEWEEGEGLAVAVFGGPSKYHLKFEIPGHLPSDELGRILAEIRRTWEHQGEVTEVLGAGFLTARGLWTMTSRRFKNKLTRLMDVLTTSVERGARSPDADS